MNKDINISKLAQEEKKSNKVSDKKEMDRRIATWQIFLLNNLNIFAKDILGIKLKFFQEQLLLEMFDSETFMFIGSRGIGKKERLTFMLNNEQKQFINTNYENLKNDEICDILKISQYELKIYANNHKLKKSMKGSKSYNNILKELLDLRKNKKYNLYDYINKKNEPKIDNSLLYKSKYGKYYVNQDYFENIDNEWKSYWLGFLFADGCVTIKRNSKNSNKMDYNLDLTLCEKDYSHIEKFKNSLQNDSPIKEKNIRFNDKNIKSYRITICNKKICEDLNNIGCTPKKTFSVKFPNINEDLIRHFIRGYFDGDGCIHINIKNNTVCFSIIGTYDMLNYIKNYFNDNNIKCKISKNKNIYELRCNNKYDVGEIYKLLYKESNICLDRKLKKFDILYCLD